MQKGTGVSHGVRTNNLGEIPQRTASYLEESFRGEEHFGGLGEKLEEPKGHPPKGHREEMKIQISY